MADLLPPLVVALGGPLLALAIWLIARRTGATLNPAPPSAPPAVDRSARGLARPNGAQHG